MRNQRTAWARVRRQLAKKLAKPTKEKQMKHVAAIAASLLLATSAQAGNTAWQQDQDRQQQAFQQQQAEQDRQERQAYQQRMEQEVRTQQELRANPTLQNNTAYGGQQRREWR